MPQHETVSLDANIVDTLLRDLVGPAAQLALIDIAENVGLSKRGVQDALGHLSRRKLIGVERESITAVPVYTVLRPWRR